MAILERPTTNTPTSSMEHSEYGRKPLKVLFDGRPRNPLQAEVFYGLRDHMEGHGVVVQRKPDKETNLIITATPMSKDVPVHQLALLRYGRAVDRYQVKVVGVSTTPYMPKKIEELESRHLAKVLDIPNQDHETLIAIAKGRGLSPKVAIGYPQLPRVGCSYALIVEGDERGNSPKSAFIVGLEQSHPEVAVNGRFFANILDKLAAPATARMIIANKERRDIVLPHEVWLGSSAPEDVILAGKLMQEMGMYPPQFPHKNFISRLKDEFYAHWFELTGLSFGNTSRRALGEEAQYGLFWMSRSGAKKDALKREEVYLAAGLMEGTNIMGRVPVEGLRQVGRMSVDAIEAQIIYGAFPQVNATAHGHWWIIDPESKRPIEYFRGYREIAGTYIVCTDIQEPCGSVELGEVTATAIAQSPDPSRTTVLQLRHGANALGSNYTEMFNRFGVIRDSGLMTNEIPQDVEVHKAA